jgi:hypothetical protein
MNFQLTSLQKFEVPYSKEQKFFIEISKKM